MYLLLFKFASLQVLFQQHFYRYALIVIGVALIVRILFAFTNYYKSLQLLCVFGLLCLAIGYFGLQAFCILSVLFSTSYYLGQKLLNRKEPILAAAIVFFFIVQIYSVVGLLLSPSIAFHSILVTSVVIMIFVTAFQVRILKLLPLIVSKLGGIVSSIPLVGLILIMLAFVYGSMPQTAMNWDSVYANLYNARWYVESNSFQPLEESISSIFPQQAILYYSFFYAVGGFQSLQIAYIIPLLLLLFVFKKIALKFSFSRWYEYAMYVLLFVPIVLAQSASGYYDLFIASMIMISMYTMIYADISSYVLRSIFAALFLGFAVASKFFAGALVPFFILIAGVRVYKNTIKRKLSRTLICMVMFVILTCGPLSLWMYRSFIYTGSPVFPFFQNLFRTKDFWSSVSSVEQNAMTQTTISSSAWLRGGFLVYPVLTYFRSENFVEGTRGYPGLVYIILLPAQAIFILLLPWKLIRKKLTVHDVVFLSLFISFVLVGLVARYYRYLWPIQLALGVSTFILLWKYLQTATFRLKSMLIFVVVFLYVIHAVDLMESYRFVPEQPRSNLFSPDILKESPTDPLFSTINSSSDVRPILDASQYTPSRLYFAQRTFMCNWYWVAGDKKVQEAMKDVETTNAFLQKFSFVITSNDDAYSANYCVSLMKQATNLKLVAKDEYHNIYVTE